MHRFSRKRRRHSLLQAFEMCRHYHKRRQMAGGTRGLIGQRRLQFCLPLRSSRRAMQILRTMSANPIGLIVFNLGYLPGGDKQRATQAETTLASLQAALDKLTVGGLLSVTMYWGHEAGKTERAAVLRWAAALDRSTYHCVHTDMCNQPNCPPEILFVTRKKSRGSLSAQDSRESDGNGHAR